ncbi:tRNA (guanosine(46)-N7)-methyltransferase TrmB [Litorivicinus sp.]|nr:tRNA (guanosine(46)-N7)-methyltransferase TrmB [Litorivicinus sp.]MDC1208928.1 tRNA (guanosine(46)-N7)-methyltransferase TrmB [Litorivicinus sp.]MDC1240435.1 tRNA (guanosine(46)-N7)-methyltransferase TrmB [Litorivicinus sp.]
MTLGQRRRTIRSFVSRSGRMTDAQDRAYQSLWAELGLVCQNNRLDLDAAFGRRAPLVMEIGFGMGDSLLKQALNEPHRNFLGIEIHKPGIGRLMNEVNKAGATNVRVLCQDAVEVLADGLGPKSLHGVQIYFPDPWHKKRHNKRRLIQPEFIDLLARRVESGGFCHVATDWAPYAESMLSVFTGTSAWKNTSSSMDYVSKPDRRPVTKFETRGVRLGHEVFDLVYLRQASD